MKLKSLGQDMQSRRKFASLVTAAFILSPFALLTGTGSTGPVQRANPKTKNSKGKQKSVSHQVMMEHIPPTRITSGSFIVEAQMTDFGPDAVNTGAMHRKRKRGLPLPYLTGVRVINIDGACLFNGYNKTTIECPAYENVTKGTVEIWLRDENSPESDIAIRQDGDHLKIESDKKLAKDILGGSSPFRFKVHHPDNLTIKKVIIKNEQGDKQYEFREANEILLHQVLIW